MAKNFIVNSNYWSVLNSADERDVAKRTRANKQKTPTYAAIAKSTTPVSDNTEHEHERERDMTELKFAQSRVIQPVDKPNVDMHISDDIWTRIADYKRQWCDHSPFADNYRDCDDCDDYGYQ